MASKMEQFLEKVNSDSELQTKVRSTIDIAKIVALAQEAGVQLAPNDVTTFFSSRASTLSKSELDEMNGLDQVVGGMRSTSCNWTCSNNSRSLC
jgi:predicted ribosomally synthesized peptide with nif11-like leader